jgi:hypothetical protein
MFTAISIAAPQVSSPAIFSSLLKSKSRYKVNKAALKYALTSENSFKWKKKKFKSTIINKINKEMNKKLPRKLKSMLVRNTIPAVEKTASAVPNKA